MVIGWLVHLMMRMTTDYKLNRVGGSTYKTQFKQRHLTVFTNLQLTTETLTSLMFLCQIGICLDNR